VVLEYDGTDFCGFQRQPNGLSVQECLERALLRLTGRETRVVAAGRTDAGVHAWAQVVNFRSSSRISVADWPAALNSALPASIAALEAREAPEGFHARRCAKRKAYLYRLLNRPVRSPLEARYAWHYPRPLNLESMLQALQAARGKHDFSAFARREPGDRRSPVRTLSEARCWREGEVVNVLLEADGFLYHMARSLVGTLVEIGAGARPAEDMAELLRSGERSRAGATAPPQGLFLARVDYDCEHLRASFGRKFE